MILIDTNVLLRVAQPTHSHCAIAKEAVKTARLRGFIPVHRSPRHLRVLGRGDAANS